MGSEMCIRDSSPSLFIVYSCAHAHTHTHTHTLTYTTTCLAQAYCEYAKIEHPVEKEKQLHRIIPVFCQNSSKYSVNELETRFPEVLDFAEQISLLFVRHVTQIAHPQNASRYRTVKGGNFS